MAAQHRPGSGGDRYVTFTRTMHAQQRPDSCSDVSRKSSYQNLSARSLRLYSKQTTASTPIRAPQPLNPPERPARDDDPSRAAHAPQPAPCRSSRDPRQQGAQYDPQRGAAHATGSSEPTGHTWRRAHSTIAPTSFGSRRNARTASRLITLTRPRQPRRSRNPDPQAHRPHTSPQPSRGAPSSHATSAATGIPTHGTPTTTGSSSGGHRARRDSAQRLDGQRSESGHRSSPPAAPPTNRARHCLADRTVASPNRLSRRPGRAGNGGLYRWPRGSTLA